ncbi:MAG TPA: EamA family transporter [Bacteroidota bacterium]|nr:EamA family transporter [Bacteroidota bacterium]
MKEVRGILMIIGAAVLWGASATAAKALLNQRLDPVLVVQSRVTFSLILLLIYFLLFRPQFLHVGLNELWKFALLGCIGVAGTNFTYYYTIRESTVATAILIQYTAPLVVMLYAVWSKQERFTIAKFSAMLLSLLGCFLAVGAYDRAVLTITPAGMVTGIASILGFAFLTIFTHYVLRTHSVWTMTFYSVLFATLFWLVVNPPWAVAQAGVQLPVWGALFLLAVFSLLIPHTLFFGALRWIEPSRAIITSTLEPIVAIVSAGIILGEVLDPPQAIGAVLVLAAILLLHVYPEEHLAS